MGRRQQGEKHASKKKNTKVEWVDLLKFACRVKKKSTSERTTNCGDLYRQKTSRKAEPRTKGNPEVDHLRRRFKRRGSSRDSITNKFGKKEGKKGFGGVHPDLRRGANHQSRLGVPPKKTETKKARARAALSFRILRAAENRTSLWFAEKREGNENKW